MDYKVITEAPAQRDALEYAQFILNNSHSREPALKWLANLEAEIGQLGELPRRHRLIDEQEEFSIELRQFLYHSHRVIFHVNALNMTVHVLRVYHQGQDSLKPTSIDF